MTSVECPQQNHEIFNKIPMNWLSLNLKGDMFTYFVPIKFFVKKTIFFHKYSTCRHPTKHIYFDWLEITKLRKVNCHLTAVSILRPPCMKNVNTFVFFNW